MLTNRKVSTIQSQIADILRTELIFGDYLPGEKLNEQDLAARFDVSRGPIREVLLILHKEGLIESKRNCGNFVCQPLSEPVNELMLSFKSSIEQFSSAEAVCVTTHQFNNLSSLTTQMEVHLKHGELNEFRAAELEFQQLYIELAAGKDLSNLWYLMAIRVDQNQITEKSLADKLELYQQQLSKLQQINTHANQ
ncbi:GntR family transcriptional regulator [Catenovulum agarivorans DS-2]|uniref:GntR family transcriptional regulator n=1 Tax=Catenovulum agarivorans DS-2 TaxID=1328313 RepID=W7QZF1_9ALTE|nr:GntR family transcriptional regulator [Catenovulum agarivorans]EWH10735.1 GntR family transcriptional regulator [Catenovulum agarivorans DS-2]